MWLALPTIVSSRGLRLWGRRSMMPSCGGCRDSHRQMLSGKCFTGGVRDHSVELMKFDVEWSGLYLEFSAGHSEILSKHRFAAATDA